MILVRPLPSNCLLFFRPPLLTADPQSWLVECQLFVGSLGPRLLWSVCCTSPASSTLPPVECRGQVPCARVRDPRQEQEKGAPVRHEWLLKSSYAKKEKVQEQVLVRSPGLPLASLRRANNPSPRSSFSPGHYIFLFFSISNTLPVVSSDRTPLRWPASTLTDRPLSEPRPAARPSLLQQIALATDRPPRQPSKASA